MTENEIEKNNKNILEAANAAISKGDYEGFLQYCSDDTTWEFVGAQTLNGKEAVRAWMKTAYRQPPVLNVTNLIAEKDFVIALGTITVYDEQQHPLTSRYCDVWTVRKDKLTSLRAFVVANKEAATA